MPPVVKWNVVSPSTGWAGARDESDESWDVIRWVVPHQPFQFMSGQEPRIGPNMFLRDPGANILEAPRSEVVIDPRCATVGAK